MPFVQDFDELFARGSFSLKVPNWRPLVIEYGYGYIQNVSNWYWRIQGTTHTFRMPYAEIMQQTHGKYDEHIQKFLQGFREDYLGWAYGGFKEPWMCEYHEQYKNLIEL